MYHTVLEPQQLVPYQQELDAHISGSQAADIRSKSVEQRRQGQKKMLKRALSKMARSRANVEFRRVIEEDIM